MLCELWSFQVSIIPTPSFTEPSNLISNGFQHLQIKGGLHMVKTKVCHHTVQALVLSRMDDALWRGLWNRVIFLQWLQHHQITGARLVFACGRGQSSSHLQSTLHYTANLLFHQSPTSSHYTVTGQ